MKQIIIPVGYDTNVSMTPSQFIGISGAVVLLAATLVILIKSFQFDK